MGFHLFARDLKTYERAAGGDWGDFDRTAKNFGAFTHGNEADAGLTFGGAKAFAVIFDFESQGGGFKLQTNPGFFCAGMTRDIIECFLKDAIDLNAGGCSHGVGVS
jgi:hypothetical protein